MSQGQLVENLAVIVAAVPIDTTGAAVAGDWVNLKNYRRAAILIAKGAWAGGTPAVTLNQATSAAGAGSKALAFTWQYKGTALTADQLSKNAVTSNTFNLAATANEYHVIEIHCQDLDQANGFNYFQAAVASPGANADLIAMIYILGDPNWAALPSTRPSAIT